MPIANANTFTYTGYTLGGALPTLYFNEGRYTQVHDDADNIGWHPLAHAAVHRINITPAAVATIMAISPDNTVAESAFGQQVIAGHYTDNTAAGTLCECFTNADGTVSVHVSRGRFMTPGVAGFNGAFSQAYARAIVAVGVLAPNEQ